MVKNDWNSMSNIEIRMKMDSIKMEYESTKNKVNKLLDVLDELNDEYNKANKVLEIRSK